MFTDLYELLQVSPDADAETIKKSVTASAAQWSKRAAMASSLEKRQIAERMVQQIAEARATLLDADRRAAYDARRNATSGLSAEVPEALPHHKNDSETLGCRFCEGPVSPTAKKCRWCGEWLQPEAQTPPSPPKAKDPPPSNPFVGPQSATEPVRSAPTPVRHDEPMKAPKGFMLPLFVSVLVLVTAVAAGQYLFSSKEMAVTQSEIPSGETPSIETGATDADVTTASGLKYTELEPGFGAIAEAGDTVQVHYTGWLADGTKFDSSVDRGQPFEFPLGQGRVIPGWDEGVAGMKVGEKRKLVIPPDLGYGSRDMGQIPPYSTLVFEVELLGFTGAASTKPAPAAGASAPAKVQQAAAGGDGAAVFSKNNCAACHGAKGEGAVGPNLQQIEAKGEEHIRHTVLNGRGAMPAFKGQIESAELDALITYVNSL